MSSFRSSSSSKHGQPARGGLVRAECHERNRQRFGGGVVGGGEKNGWGEVVEEEGGGGRETCGRGAMRWSSDERTTEQEQARHRECSRREERRTEKNGMKQANNAEDNREGRRRQREHTCGWTKGQRGTNRGDTDAMVGRHGNPQRGRRRRTKGETDSGVPSATTQEAPHTSLDRE
jgi:hypothetical protein